MHAYVSPTVLSSAAMIFVLCSSASLASSGNPSNPTYTLWEEEWGVIPGIYEIIFTSISTQVVTQGRIRTTSIGNAGFTNPTIEICDLAFDSSGRNYFAQKLFRSHPEKQADQISGQVYYKINPGQSDAQIVKLSADKSDPKILRGRRHNFVTGEDETITMYHVSDGDMYQGGQVSISSSNKKYPKVVSDNICYSRRTEPVIDGNDTNLGDIEIYSINMIDNDAKSASFAIKGAIDIYYYPESAPYLPSYDTDAMNIYYDAFASKTLMSSPMRFDQNTNQPVRTVFKRGPLSFEIKMNGFPGSESSGEVVTGKVELTSQLAH